jgi:uncharacterized surface protein with fasciclin (FAS1) repeats
MKMGKNMKKWTPLLVSFLLILTSCVSELDKYYATPDWLKGNSWEVLDKKGNFKLFLSAVEKSSFKDLVQGKGLVTVMAPTDSAFQVYLTKHNYSSIDVISKKELDKLVGFHLLFYSFNKETFEDYKPNGIESQNSLKGSYYKFRTKSRDSISVEYDANAHKSYKVMHFDRFLPVFSNNLFTSYKIDAKSNYEFFYPNSTWSGTDGFNISEASVKEYSIVSDNGYVYTINKVLEPLETVYTNLKTDANYSDFATAYERFASYQYDVTATTDYGKGDSLFQKYYSGVLPAISSEWPVSSYLSLAILSYGAHNVFAPDNSAMQAFFNKYWAPYYSDISKVNFEPMLALLTNHVYSSTILFPGQIEAGTLKSNFGNTIQFDRSSVQKKNICVNGSIYGLNQVIVPPMFEKVTAPMFCDTAYTIILDIMKNGGYVPTLISDATKFNVFYPTNKMITGYTNLDGKLITFETGTNKYGTQVVYIDGDNGPVPMNTSQKKTFAGSQIATEMISSRNGNEAVYRTLISYNYIYTKANKVYSSYLYNLGVDTKVPTFTKINSYSNGDAYALSGDGASALVPESNQFKNLTTATCPSALKTFIAYAGKALFTTQTPPYSFLQGDKFILLIPPATGLATILSSVTPTPSVGLTPEQVIALANAFKPYFINVSASNLLDYPFPGANVQGQLVSFGKKSDGTTATFTLVDRGTELVVIDAKGNEAKVTNYFPYIYGDGAVYLIDRLLSVE